MNEKVELYITITNHSLGAVIQYDDGIVVHITSI